MGRAAGTKIGRRAAHLAIALRFNPQSQGFHVSKTDWHCGPSFYRIETKPPFTDKKVVLKNDHI